MRTRSMLSRWWPGRCSRPLSWWRFPSASPALAVPGGFHRLARRTYVRRSRRRSRCCPVATCSCWRRGARSAASRPTVRSVRPGDRSTLCAEGERGLLERGARSVVRDDRHDLRLRDRARAPVSAANTLSKFTMSGGVVSAASEQVLIDNIAWTATNHNGGTVEVGRDGFLYLSVGEGAVMARAQDLASLGGKILRITTTGQPAPGNPFLTAAGHGPCARAGQSAAVCDEIYALGSAQPVPYRLRSELDDDAVPDQRRRRRATWEEVDDGIAGANYGWPVREGPCPIGQTAGCSTDPNFTDPQTAYPRTVGTYIVGGAFVPNGWWGAAYDGGYLFADGSANRMWLMNAAGAVDYNAPVHGRQPQRDDRSGVRRAQRRTGAVLRQQRQRATPQDRRAQRRDDPRGGPGLPRRRRAPPATAAPATGPVRPRCPRVHRLSGGAAGARYAQRHRRADRSSRRWAAAHGGARRAGRRQRRPGQLHARQREQQSRGAVPPAELSRRLEAGGREACHVERQRRQLRRGRQHGRRAGRRHGLDRGRGVRRRPRHRRRPRLLHAGRWRGDRRTLPGGHARRVCSTAAPARRPATTTRAPTTATPRSCASPSSVEAVCRPPRRPCRSP